MNKQIILYAILGILVLVLLFFTIFPGMIDAVRDSGKSVSDLCSPELGYTEDSWKEHMSHHPNIYSECLK